MIRLLRRRHLPRLPLTLPLVVGVDLPRLLAMVHRLVHSIGLIGRRRLVVRQSPHSRLMLRLLATVTAGRIGNLLRTAFAFFTCHDSLLCSRQFTTTARKG